MFFNWLFKLLLVYRSKIDFCMLVLHPATLLNLFIILYIFYGIFSMIYIKDVICKHKEFYFFSCLDIFFLPNCSARISRTMLNRTDESGHLSLFLIFEEKFTVFFNVFTLLNRSSMSFLHMVFIMLKHFSSTTSC